MKDDGFDGAIRMFERIGSELADGDTFFRVNSERYRQVCIRSAFQTLLANRPDGLDDSTWRENAGEFVDMITAMQFDNRLDIAFTNRLELDRMAAKNRGQNLANFTPITYEDVLEWVKTDPGDGGKDKTLFEESKRMSERHDEQIAYDVHQGIKQHRLGTEKKDYSRINQRLEDWMNSKVLKGDLDSLLRLVLQGWQMVMEPIIERDFTEWVDETLRGRAG